MSFPTRRTLLAATLGVAAGTVGCSIGPETSSTTTVPSPTAPHSSSAGFTNPVFAANFPDPQVVATGGGYLAIATNGNGMNVQTLTSTDMAAWRQGSDALPKVANWSSPGRVWAPEAIRWGDGSWRLHYTTRSPDPEVQCLSVASSARPEGPYTDRSARPLICQTSLGGSIDSSPFLDDRGRGWLYWKNDGNAIDTDTWLWVQSLSADGLSTTGQPIRLLQQDLPWEGHLVEAPAVVQVDGIFHMFYSANDYGSADYAVGHATATSPTGPFTKDPDPVLVSNAAAAGPGHCQLVQVHGQWWMAFHAWAPDGIGDEATGRQLWLSRVRFDARRVRVDPPTAQYDQLP